jgi:hypothetical protein
MIKTILLTCAPVALFALATPALAQDTPEPAKKSKEMTYTGCLNKGERENHFSFTDLDTGKKLNVTGKADLQKHSANHTVKITGHETAKVFNVTKVEHVSPTCEAKPSK